MARCRSRGFFGILTVVNPPVAFQSVSGGTAGHELPHPPSTSARKRQRMEPRFGLSQIDQVLRNTFFLQNPANHFVILPAAGKGALQCSPPTCRKVTDVSGYRVRHHQRQIGVRGLDFSFSLCLEVRVNRERDLVGFVDRRGLRLLLRKAIAFLQGLKLETVYAVEDTVKFLLQALVRAQVQGTPQQEIEGAIEVLFGSFEMPGFIVVLPDFVFIFNLGNQLSDGIRFNLDLSIYGSYSLGVDVCLRSGRRSRAQLRRGGGSGRQQGRRPLRRLTRDAAQNQGKHWRDQNIEFRNPHVYL